MSLARRTVLGLATAAGATALVGSAAPALGRPAPSRTFPLGVREFTWDRAGRTLVTRIFSPAATGTPGGDPVPDAPIADGPFPVVEWSHGLGGNPESYGAATVSAKVLFVHGDQDPICDYGLARQAYAALPAPKAFMNHAGQGHDEFIWNGPSYDQTVATSLDWMRWSLYGDIDPGPCLLSSFHSAPPRRAGSTRGSAHGALRRHVPKQRPTRTSQSAVEAPHRAGRPVLRSNPSSKPPSATPSPTGLLTKLGRPP
jgi:hypothetical protein